MAELGSEMRKSGLYLAKRGSDGIITFIVANEDNHDPFIQPGLGRRQVGVHWIQDSILSSHLPKTGVRRTVQMWHYSKCIRLFVSPTKKNFSVCL